ncbi:DNA polymerase I [Longirhabdus pacifica]|uniref:DNA polymerase I n=1 Tax=Longirhabdus pacifica TaxID=2305227 RepID=UPI001008B9B6|nr:DNA polymerase I [Longirhabdus pacifica]
MQKLIIVDGNSIAYRAFFALPLLSNAKGIHTNAVYGFTTMLLKLIENEKPTHFMVAFDAGKITFRHEEYKEYKGKRQKTPPELSEQFPIIKKMLDAFSISQFELEGYEADDIIGTLTKVAEQQDMKVMVVTGDKDMLQLASENVEIALTRKGISEMEKYSPATIDDKYGLKPEQIIDLKGLMGDTSDNIPGVPGIGEKTGLKLLHQYDSITGIYEHIHELKGKMKEKLEQNKSQAEMSKQLATIFREVPMEQDWESLKYDGLDQQKVVEMFTELEFRSLLDQMQVETSTVEAVKEEIAYTIIDESNINTLQSVLPHIHVCHIEVTGANPHQGEVQGISLYDEDDNHLYFVPSTLMQQSSLSFMIDWLQDGNHAKQMYDAHRAEVALHWMGIKLQGVSFDTMLAAYLLDPTDSGQQMHRLCHKYGVTPIAPDEDVYGKGAKFKVPAVEQLAEFCCHKALATCRLAKVLKENITDYEMEQLYYELELPLSHVLASMELEGIKVNTEELKTYGTELNEQIQQIKDNIYEMADAEFNINSPKQLGEILFEKLQLPVVKKTKTGYSTDAEVLEKLKSKHEIVEHILHYRQLAKLQSTYVEGLLKEVNDNTGKVHTYYQQTIAATGRLSSQFPNLQNIPIRMEEGRKIRKVFTAEDKEWSIVAADYSQIELRVLAHISQDERLKQAFTENKDIHTQTAMDVFGVKEDEVDSEMRRQAKAVNFGIVYGISDYGLSQNLNITRAAAADFIQQYFNVFEGVHGYMEDIVKKAKQDGYVSTMLNRRRSLPEINARNFNQRSFAERTAMNTPIQGTAADIIKLAMIKMNEQLKEKKLRSKMLLQVHDELVFAVPMEEVDMMKQLVSQVMEKALLLDVPLKVDVSVGSNWYEAK